MVREFYHYCIRPNTCDADGPHFDGLVFIDYDPDNKAGAGICTEESWKLLKQKICDRHNLKVDKTAIVALDLIGERR